MQNRKVDAVAVTSLADIGQASGLGAGDATSDATNAASLIFDGGRLLYTGSGNNSYDNRVQNIFQTTQTPSVSINRLFTLTAAGGPALVADIFPVETP